MRLTHKQGIILTGFTGKLFCRFSDFHADVERRLGRSVWTHEFADEEFARRMRDLYRDDLMSILPEETVDETL